MTYITETNLEISGVPTRILTGGTDSTLPPLVLLHGGMPGLSPYWHGAHIFETVLSTFLRTRRVIAFDNSFAKTAQGGEAPSTVDGLAEHATAVIQALGLPPVQLVGHDLGGLTALVLAMQKPSLLASVAVVASAEAAPDGDPVDSLAMISPPGPPWSKASQFWAYDRLSYSHHHIDEALLESSVAAASSPIAKQVLSHMSEPTYKLRLPGSAAANRYALFSAARNDGISVPTQIIWAANDPISHRENGFLLFKMLAEKQVKTQFHLINRSGHFPFREQPEQFIHLTSAFASGLLS